MNRLAFVSLVNDSTQFDACQESLRQVADTMHGYVPHHQSVTALLEADAVFVPLNGVPEGERALVCRANSAKHWRLAALPSGDGADLITSKQAGLVVPPTDASELARALGQMIDAQQQGNAMSGCPRDQFRGFSRRSLAARPAAVFGAVVARQADAALPDLW